MMHDKLFGTKLDIMLKRVRRSIREKEQAEKKRIAEKEMREKERRLKMEKLRQKKLLEQQKQMT